MSPAGTPERSSACFAATAPSSVADKSLSVPPKPPNPVRTPDRKTTSVLEPWVFMGKAPRETRGISARSGEGGRRWAGTARFLRLERAAQVRRDPHKELIRRAARGACNAAGVGHQDRKSTRLNSSHSQISYAVFCLKKKKEEPLDRL